MALRSLTSIIVGFIFSTTLLCAGEVFPPGTVAKLVISPATATLHVSDTRTFTANAPVLWLVNDLVGGNSTVGTIVAGKYTAPAAVPPAGTVTIKTVATTDPTKFATATVALLNAVPVLSSLSPTHINTGLQFTIAITGSNFLPTAIARLDDGTPLKVTNVTAGGIKISGTSSSTAGSSLKLTITNPAPGATTSSPREIAVEAPVTVAVTPHTLVLHAAESRTFTASVDHTQDHTVVWKVNDVVGGNANVGTIIVGKYTAPAVIPSTGSVVVKAISNADPTKSDSSTLALLNPVPLISSLNTSHINTLLGFTLTIKGTGFDSNATASLDDGTKLAVKTQSTTDIVVSGLSVSTAGTVLKLVVTNPAPGLTASKPRELTVDPPVAVSLSPDKVSVRAGTTATLHARVSNNADQTVTWAVNGKIGGDAINGTVAKGIYTPPVTIPATPVTITATSVADATRSNTATVTLLNALPVIRSATTPVKAGSNAVIAITGIGFAQGAQATLGALNLVTTFVDSTHLTATGTISPPVGGLLALTVTNPNPGGEISATVLVAVQNAGTKANYAEARRLLEQATWGPTPDSIAHVMDIGVDTWIDEQFDLGKSPISQYTSPIDDSTDLKPLQLQFFHNAVAGADQLRQRTAFALGQIVVVSENKLPKYAQMMPYQQMLLNDAFGTYHQLLKDVTLSPAMGHFLDMVNNDKPSATTSPDENYARELMQLFSLGLVKLNPDATPAGTRTYTEDDVRALARVFTGWTYPPCFGASRFPNPPCYSSNMTLFANHHDTDVKTVLGNNIQNASGDADLDDALLAIEKLPGADPAIPNVAPFVSLRLIQHLVTSGPSPDYVRRVATQFALSGGNLKEVIKAILKDPEAGYGNAGADLPRTQGHLREPVLYSTALLRALGATYVLDPPLQESTVTMGQDLFNSPSVFNYFSPFYRIPKVGAAAPEFQILSQATAFARTNYAYRAIRNQLSRNIIVDISNFRRLAADRNPVTQTASLTALLNAVSQALLGKPMPPDMLTAILPAMTATTDASTRVDNALFLVASSAQYQVQR